jgi:RNA polymerase sigma-70 factor (ECF subfamily)
VHESIIHDVELSDRAAEPASQRDADLVAQAAQGDKVAFERLVEMRLDRSFRTACAILGNEADARDATQETFVSAWVNLPRLRDVARFDAWLNRVLTNRCRDVLRRRHRSREIVLDGIELLDVGQTDASLDTHALNAAFERLSLAHRQLLVLHHLLHRPVAEIAQQLDVPVGTAKWRLHAARQALERALEVER